MRAKFFFKFGLPLLFFAIPAIASVFLGGIARAALPIKAGLGQACGASTPCESQFFCSSGWCVQCMNEGDCDQSLNQSCTNNVCTLPGGNTAGGLCVADSNCKSGLTCGAKNICQAAGSVAPSTSVIPSGSMAPAGGEENWMGIDLSIQDVADIINGLACWLTRIATAIMVIFLVLAGLRFMNARGDPTKYGNAKKNLQHEIIGIMVIMGVYVIIATVANAVGRTDFSLIPLVC